MEMNKSSQANEDYIEKQRADLRDFHARFMVQP
jgi:hypothetical protein